jgi:hypothetical protein
MTNDEWKWVRRDPIWHSSFVIGNSLVTRNLGIRSPKTGLSQDHKIVFFHVGKFFARNRIARHQDHFHRLRQVMLVQPETFAQQAPGAAALHRAANLFAGDHAEPWRCAGGQLVPVGNQAALRQPFTGLAHPCKFTALGQARRPAQAQTSGIWHSGTVVWRRRGHDARDLNRRQAFAARATAAGKRGTAALGGRAGKEPVLAFAADFGRLILAFHKFKKIIPAEKPERGRIAIKQV